MEILELKNTIVIKSAVETNNRLKKAEEIISRTKLGMIEST
jgi:hypothetical protein